MTNRRPLHIGIALFLPILMVASVACVSKGAYEELQSQQAQTQQQLAAQQAEVSQAKTRASGLETALATALETSSTLKLDLAKTQRTVSNLESQLSNLTKELSTAQSKASVLETEVSSLKSELSQSKKAIAALNPLTITSTPAPLTSKGTAVSSSVSLNLGSGIVLTYDPAQPVTGRSVRFSLAGLTPWSSFSVTFVNPSGMPADWIDEREAFYTKTGSQEFVKTHTLFADGNGKFSWVRTNALDPEGQWTVKINVNSKTYEGRYTLIPLQLQVNISPYLGVSFRQYSGSISEVYATAGVPLATALDLSGMLYFINESLKPWLGQSYVQIPNLYLFSNRELFNKAMISAGKTTSVFEAGRFVPGKYRGIYIIADSLKSETIKTLIHEYTHLLVDEAVPNIDIPAWLNEGFAKHLELHLGSDFGAGLRAQREVFSMADEIYVNLVRNSVFTLSQLRSQKDWNTQPNKELLNLQYSQAYMAVRYMLERFGNQSVALVLNEMNKGQSFDTAFQKITGVSVSIFERNWLTWQRNWKDSKRELVRQYVGQVEAILQGISGISSDRANFLRVSGSLSFSSMIPTQTQFVTRAVALESKAIALTPPTMLVDFHGELTAFTSLYKRWLQTALDAFKQESNVIIDRANAMIPEVDGRESRLLSQLINVKFDWGLK